MSDKDYIEEKVAPGDHTVDKAVLDDTSSHDENEIVPGSEGITRHELATLRHVADRLPYTAWLVVTVEFAERWTYYGTTNVYNNYIRFPMPPGSKDGSVLPQNRAEGVAGALGKGVQKSFAIRTFNTFLVFVMPILGGIIADTAWGRYKTILVFSIVTIVGHIILVAGSTPASLAKPETALGLLIFAITVMGIGTGAIKANVSPLVAEQYTGKLRKETLKSGEVVIKSPALTIQTVYLWFYWAINLGSTAAISASFLARDKGYWAAFLLPTVVFALVPLVLVVGKKNYVTTPPRGSILLETMRVISMSLAPCWSLNPYRTWRNIKTSDFWGTAKPSHYAGSTIPSRITWDDDFVGEVERTVKACAVFLYFPFFWLCYSQIDGNLGTVAGSMTLNGTPNDLIQNLNPISLIILIPIFDGLIYPFLRKMKINFSPIKRIYTGFLVAGLAMVYAAVLEKYLYDTNPCDNGNQPSACVDADKNPLHSPINVWVVSGPYILVAISEIFASITSLEYAFTKAPQRMKSVVMAFGQFQTAVAAAINFALTGVNVEQKFVWLFASFAITAWVVGTIFFFTFRDLDRRETEINTVGTGQRAGFVDESPSTTITEKA
ncbi:peptide/h+ symporter protein [Mycena floridula]|nr:peptide/h+ symporter protein [Mycena floridula]